MLNFQELQPSDNFAGPLGRLPALKKYCGRTRLPIPYQRSSRNMEFSRNKQALNGLDSFFCGPQGKNTYNERQ